MTKTPYDYQSEARKITSQYLNAGISHILANPTGTGKTFTACLIIQDRIKIGERLFVLTPQEEIFDQWEKEFIHFGIDYGYTKDGMIFGKNKPVYLCMPMTLSNILKKLPEKLKPDIIIIDECVSSEAETWQEIFDFYPNAVRFGLDAAPHRTDSKPLSNSYEKIYWTITQKEAIERCFLSKYMLYEPEEYKLNIPINNGDYDVNVQAGLLGKPRIIGDVIEWYGRIFNGLPVMGACSTFEHAEQMTEEFNNAGWKFEHIHSLLNKYERKRMIRQIRNKEINGLCTVGIGIKGLDIPGLFGLLWLRRTMSISIYRQFIGRILRLFTGKEYGVILDFVGNVHIHGLPDRDITWNLDGENIDEEKPDYPQTKICPQCGVDNAYDNVNCHICKYNFETGTLTAGKKRLIPVMEDGTIVLLNEDQVAENYKIIKKTLEKNKIINQQCQKAEKVEPKKKKIEKITLLKNGLERKTGLLAEALNIYE